MPADERAQPLRARFFTPGTRVLAALAAIGVAGYLYRLIFGLRAATHLSDAYPWGIWISIDVASGVALAAGGFTTAALVDVFGKREYHRLLRPALLTAMLGYTFVVIGLLADLGRYYNVWHPILPSMWQGNSVLFEVGICVMTYLTVLYIEFMPIVVERFRGRVALPGALRIFNGLLEGLLRLAGRILGRTITLFILAGVVLSCLHQSSLGTLMLIAPTKMHPLWLTSSSPLFFLLSAIAVGFPMVIFESLLAARSFKLPPETSALSSLARFTPFLLGVYLAVKIVDLTLREAWGYLGEGSLQSTMYLIEMLGGVVLPIVLLSLPRVRATARGLLVSASLIIAGVVLNRINVFIVAYRPMHAPQPYFPSPFEIAVTVGLVALLVLVYRLGVMIFPVVSVPPSRPRPAPGLPGQAATALKAGEA